MKQFLPYNKAFYKKHGIKITEEPLLDEDRTEAEKDLIQEMFDYAHSPNPSIARLEKVVADFPHIPELKNYLGMTYSAKGDKKNAKRVMLLARYQHPNYFFGILAEVEELLKENQLEKADKLLRNPRSIAPFFPNDDVYHRSRFMDYQSLCIVYDLAKDDIDGAIAKFQLLFDYDSDAPQTILVAQKIMMKRVTANLDYFQEENQKYVHVESHPTKVFEPNEAIPSFNHPAVEDFYFTGIDHFSEEQIQEIFDLPRATLIEDLEKVIMHNIQRFSIIKAEEKQYDEVEGVDSIIHGIYYLGALESEKSLPILLDLFRQGKGCLIYYFGEMFPNFVDESLYLIANNQLPMLKEFIFEPHVFYDPRSSVINVVEQVAWHEPERKQEVVEWIRSSLEFFIENKEDETLIDTYTICRLGSAIMNLSIVELEPLLKQAYDLDWLPDNFLGDWEEIQKSINGEPDQYRKEPMPENIFEFYSGIHKERIIKSGIGEEFLKSEAKKPPHERFIDELAMQTMMQAMAGGGPLSLEEEYDEGYFDDEEDYDYKPKGTFRNVKVKVKRNDPCPCGSGKKYKKCCINTGKY